MKSQNNEYHVLLVDDDPINREVMTKILERLGYSVESAENGKAALQCIEQSVFDVIIMDIQMPVLDGIAATRSIRLKELLRSCAKMPKNLHTPIIGVTADIQDGVQDMAMAAGMNRILAKPISRAVLAEALNSMLD